MSGRRRRPRGSLRGSRRVRVGHRLPNRPRALLRRPAVVRLNGIVADLGVSLAVISSLSRAGITEPFAIQRAVIGDAIAVREVVAKSQAGSGKTLAFAIPLVQRIRATDPRTAPRVLAPTAPDAGGGWVMRGFDARGVRRTYGVSLEDGVLRMCLDAPAFDQRFLREARARCLRDRVATRGDVGDWQDDLRVTSAAATRRKFSRWRQEIARSGGGFGRSGWAGYCLLAGLDADQVVGGGQ